MEYFGYTTACFIGCEICNAPAVDLHHIENRKSGGSKTKDYIENLMALCRECHEEYGDKKQHMEFLKRVHKKAI